MQKTLLLKRGSEEENASFTGAMGELTVDTENKTLVLHDGELEGGHPLAYANHTHEEFENMSSGGLPVPQITDPSAIGYVLHIVSEAGQPLYAPAGGTWFCFEAYFINGGGGFTPWTTSEPVLAGGENLMTYVPNGYGHAYIMKIA